MIDAGVDELFYLSFFKAIIFFMYQFNKIYHRTLQEGPPFEAFLVQSSNKQKKIYMIEKTGSYCFTKEFLSQIDNSS